MRQHQDETTIAQTSCPACGGPPKHPGACVDRDGYILPAYEALAAMWRDQGQSVLAEEDLDDLDEMLSIGNDDERRG
jgi:hypothetical protein